MKILNELQLAKELIRFPTITPVDAGVMKFLGKKLKKLGFKIKILEFSFSRVSPFLPRKLTFLIADSDST